MLVNDPVSRVVDVPIPMKGIVPVIAMVPPPLKVQDKGPLLMKLPVVKSKTHPTHSSGTPAFEGVPELNTERACMPVPMRGVVPPP